MTTTEILLARSLYSVSPRWQVKRSDEHGLPGIVFVWFQNLEPKNNIAKHYSLATNIITVKRPDIIAHRSTFWVATPGIDILYPEMNINKNFITVGNFVRRYCQ